jgi:DNA modification methylase
MGIKKMKRLADYRLNESNPRTFTSKQLEQAKRSIKDFPEMMELRPMIAHQKIIKGGNMRFRACVALGMEEVPATWLIDAENLTPEQVKEFIIKDNLPFGEWDYKDLAQNWESAKLKDWGLNIPDFWINYDIKTEDDFEEPDQVETNFSEGDIIEIGRHRLVCGDSRDPEVINAAVNGGKPRLLITDPPYGVEYDANWRQEAAQRGHIHDASRAVGKVKNDHIIDWSVVYDNLPFVEVAYVWHASYFVAEVQNGLKNKNFQIRNLIIWAKTGFVISRGNYHWQHENCWYAVKKGKRADWIGDRSQSTIWTIDHRKSESGHSTQKPVEAMAKPIRNHRGNVIDPFVGSGTTMIAAEPLGRICYAVDDDPKYCQITVDRMIRLNPEIRVLVNGKPYKK